MFYQRMDDSFGTYHASIDTGNYRLALSNFTKDWRAELSFARPDADHVTLDGEANGHRLLVRLDRMDPNRFRLMNNRFHWMLRY
jgi:hypothetical protein